jgi:hypothetical protein
MKRYSPLLAILALLGSMALSAAVAAAATPSGATTSRLAVPTPILSGSAFEEAEDEFEEEEGEEFETEECEAAFEAEELFGELEEEEEAEEEELEWEEEGCEETAAKQGTVTAPPVCLVRRAESTITTLPGSDRVDLTVHYVTWSPAAVSVLLKLKDGKGSLGLEHATKHFGLGGTLHLSTRLGDAVMERAAKAKEFDVSLRAAKTPGFCGNLLEQQLKTSKPVGRARVYSDAHGSGSGSDHGR